MARAITTANKDYKMKYAHFFIFFFLLFFTSAYSQTLTDLHVLVTDIYSNKGISSAEVRIDETAFSSKETANDGTVTFNKSIPAGLIHFTIIKEGYETYSDQYKVTPNGAENILKIKLTRKKVEKLLISGKVENIFDTELAEAGIEIKIDGIVRNTITDISGNYSIEIILDNIQPESKVRIEAKCSGGYGKYVKEMELPRNNKIEQNFKLDCSKQITTIDNIDADKTTSNRWFGFGFLTEIGSGKCEFYKFLVIPYGGFVRAYLGNRVALELQYSRSKFSMKSDLHYTSTGLKSGTISSVFAYQDITAVLDLTSLKIKKNRFRSYAGSKISYNRWAEFETTREQGNFIGRGPLPVFNQFTSVVFGCGYEYGGSVHQLPLIIVDLRFDFGTNNLMREFFIPETNTTLDYGKFYSIGLQIGIGF